MRPFARLGIALLVGAGHAGRAEADIFGYYPDATLTLGGSFDPLNLPRVTPDCFKADTEIPVDGFGHTSVSSDIRFSIRQVKDLRELQSLLRISSSMSAQYDVFSTDATSSGASESSSYTQTLSWVLVASTDFGRYRAENLRLSEEAAHLARSNLSNFVDRCGTDVVLQVKRGISVAVIFTLNTSSSSNSDTLQSQFNIGVGGDMWGVGASGGTTSAFHEAISHGDLALNVVAIGGNGASALGDLVDKLHDQDTVNGMKAVMSNYIKQLGPEKSAITQYQTGSISQFVPELLVPDFSVYNRIIEEYHFALVQNTSWLLKFRDYLSGADDYTEKSVGQIRKAYDLANSRTLQIANAARDCRDGKVDLVKALAKPSTTGTHGTGRTEKEQTVRAVEDNLKLDLLQITGKASSESKQVAYLLRGLPDRAKNRCQFDLEWLDFTSFTKLPSYPFSDPVIWSDPLAHAPADFVYANVEGGGIKSARLVDGGSRRDLVVFRRKAGDVFEGLWDRSSDPAVKMVDLIVVTRTGKEFRFSAVRS